MLCSAEGIVRRQVGHSNDLKRQYLQTELEAGNLEGVMQCLDGEITKQQTPLPRRQDLAVSVSLLKEIQLSLSLLLEVGFEHVLDNIAQLCLAHVAHVGACDLEDSYMWLDHVQPLFADRLLAAEPISNWDFVTRGIAGLGGMCPNPKHAALISFIKEASQRWRVFKGMIVMKTEKGARILAQMLQNDPNAKGEN